MRRRHRFLVAAGLLAPACAPAPAVRSTAGPNQATSPTGPASPSTEAGLPRPASASVDATTTTEAPATTEVVRVSTTEPNRTSTTVTVAPFVLPESADAELSDDEWWEAQPGYQPPARDAVLACIRSYEQGAAGYATDTGNGFYGAYQFDLTTWRSVGGTGNPAHASPAEQDARAWALYQSRGLAPWPTPARRCG